MNVGQIRRAIEGLPDEAPVVIFQTFTEDSEGGAVVVIADVHPDAGALAVVLEVTAFDDDLDGLYADEEDDEPPEVDDPFFAPGAITVNDPDEVDPAPEEDE